MSTLHEVILSFVCLPLSINFPRLAFLYESLMQFTMFQHQHLPSTFVTVSTERGRLKIVHDGEPLPLMTSFSVAKASLNDLRLPKCFRLPTPRARTPFFSWV